MLFGDRTPEKLANEVYQNRQRTSTRNGILKAEAVIRFLKVLKDFDAEYFQDIPRLTGDNTFEFCIKAIPGQGSGISLKYFFMLAGADDFIKPDRMIIRFLQGLNRKKVQFGTMSSHFVWCGKRANQATAQPDTKALGQYYLELSTNGVKRKKKDGHQRWFRFSRVCGINHITTMRHRILLNIILGKSHRQL